MWLLIHILKDVYCYFEILRKLIAEDGEKRGSCYRKLSETECSEPCSFFFVIEKSNYYEQAFVGKNLS